MWREEVGLVEMLFTYIGEIKEFETYEAWKPILVDILSSHEETRRHRLSFATAYMNAEVNKYIGAHVANVNKFCVEKQSYETVPWIAENVEENWESHDYVADVACHDEENEDVNNKTESLAFPVNEKDKIVNDHFLVAVKEDIVDEEENEMRLVYGHRNLQLEGNDDESTQSLIQGSAHFRELQCKSIHSFDRGSGDIRESQEVQSTNCVETERNAAEYMEDDDDVTVIEETSDAPFATDIVAGTFGDTSYESTTGFNQTKESVNGRMKVANFGDECLNSGSNSEKRHFRCKICGSYFKTKSYLKIHLRYHSGERPYQCSFCEKSYCQQCDLNKHLRSHNGERPFHCPMCQKSFALRWIMKRHMATHCKYGALTGKLR